VRTAELKRLLLSCELLRLQSAGAIGIPPLTHGRQAGEGPGRPLHHLPSRSVDRFIGGKKLAAFSPCFLSYSSLMAWSGITHLSVMRSPSASPNGMLVEVGPWGASVSDPMGFAANRGNCNALWRWLANTLRWFASPRQDIGNHNRGYRRTIPKRRGAASVMESSKLRNRDDAPAFWLLQGSRLRSVLGQRQMGSGMLVVSKITSQSSAQRSFIPHDDVV